MRVMPHVARVYLWQLTVVSTDATLGSSYAGREFRYLQKIKVLPCITLFQTVNFIVGFMSLLVASV